MKGRKSYLGNISQVIIRPPKEFIHYRMDKKEIDKYNHQINSFITPKTSQSSKIYKSQDFLKLNAFTNMNYSNNYRYQRPIGNDKKEESKYPPHKLLLNNLETEDNLDNDKNILTKGSFKSATGNYLSLANDMLNYKNNFSPKSDFRSNLRYKTTDIINNLNNDNLPRINIYTGNTPLKSVYDQDAYFPNVLKAKVNCKLLEDDFIETIQNRLKGLRAVSPKAKDQMSRRAKSFKGKNEYYKITHEKPGLKELFDNANLVYRGYPMFGNYKV